MAEIAAQIGVRATMDTGDFVRGAKSAEREVASLTKYIRDQNLTMAIGADEAKLYNLALAGIGHERIDALRGSLAQLRQAQATISNKAAFQGYLDSLEDFRGGTIRAASAIGMGGERGTLLGNLKELGHIIHGGGVLIGIRLLSRTFERATESIRNAAGKSGTELETAFLGSIPIIGDLTNSIKNMTDAWNAYSDSADKALHKQEMMNRAKFGEIVGQKDSSREAAKNILHESQRDLMTDYDRQRDDAKKVLDERLDDYAKHIVELNRLGVRNTEETRALEEAKAAAVQAYNQKLADIYNQEQSDNKARWDKDNEDRKKALEDRQKMIDEANKRFFETINNPPIPSGQETKDLYDPNNDPILKSMETREDMLNRFIEETRTPAERLEQQLRDLNDAFMGSADADSYARGLDAIKKQLMDLNRGSGSIAAPMATYGSAAAIQAVRSLSGNSIEAKQLAEQKRAADLLDQIKKLQEKTKNAKVVNLN